MNRAGGHWRTHASSSETELCQWDAETYARWVELVMAEDEKNPTVDKGIHCGLGVAHTPFRMAVMPVKELTEDIRRFTQLTTSGSP